MRSLVLALGLVVLCAHADAAGKRAGKAQRADKRTDKRTDKRPSKRGAARKRVARVKITGPIRGQSVGAPWAGRLRKPTLLPHGDGYFVRRPYRAYGTRVTVETVARAVRAMRAQFDDLHDLAIGDLSAARGGPISEHSSHQSGRDVDLGLYYYQPPPGYPRSFVDATEDNLDREATYALVDHLASTGKVHLMFLDFEVQRLLYDWAVANGVDEEYLARLFQFPHGRGQSIGLVRHEPNHADHLHVRLRCPPADTACR